MGAGAILPPSKKSWKEIYNMGKFIKKSKCEFRNGYIVKKNKVIAMPIDVSMQLRRLELTFQQWQYLRNQPAARPMPSLDGFEFRSRLHNADYHVDCPPTPAIDARVEEALAFCEDVDRVADNRELNNLIDQYEQLLRWCDADEFIPGYDNSELDLAELGDPLTLESGDVIALLEMMVTFPAVKLRVPEVGLHAPEVELCVDPDGDSGELD